MTNNLCIVPTNNIQLRGQPTIILSQLYFQKISIKKKIEIITGIGINIFPSHINKKLSQHKVFMPLSTK